MFRFKQNLFVFLCFFSLLPRVFAHGGGPGSTAAKLGREENSISSDGMINSPTATTLGRNHFSAGFTFDYHRYNSIPANSAHQLHHQGHDVHGKNHEEFYNLDAGFGALEDLDLYLTAPIVSKNTADIESHRNLGKKEKATGFGDMHLQAKYRFWKKHVEAALIFGLKFPTGKTDDRRKSGDKFAAENQPGSGSWDSDYGLALSRSFKQHWSAAASFLYTLKGRGAQELKSGDSFRFNFGGSYALRKLGRYPNLSFVLECNNEWELKDHSREEKRVFDSGGTTIFVTPGITSSLTKNLSLFFGIPIPVYQNLGGEHEESLLEIISGISFYF